MLNEGDFVDADGLIRNEIIEALFADIQEAEPYHFDATMLNNFNKIIEGTQKALKQPTPPYMRRQDIVTTHAVLLWATQLGPLAVWRLDPEEIEANEDMQEFESKFGAHFGPVEVAAVHHKNLTMVIPLAVLQRCRAYWGAVANHRDDRDVAH